MLRCRREPKKAGEKIFDIPIYASVKEAAETGATVSVIRVAAGACRDLGSR
jgi:succinyl-CoA synthetase alpha subunit